jgi:multidrug resistance efflux pump
MQAEASLAVSQSNLRKLQNGATKQEVTVSQANFDQANTSYRSSIKQADAIRQTVGESIFQAEKNLNDLTSSDATDVTTYEKSIQVAQSNLDNAKTTYQRVIDNKKITTYTVIEDKLAVAGTGLDVINRVVTDADGKDVLSAKNIYYLSQTNSDYERSNLLLITANDSLINAKKDGATEQANTALDQSLEALDKVFSALNNCYNALENSITTLSFSQTKLDSLKSSISTQLTIISASISAVQSSKQSLADAILSYNTSISTSEKNLEQAKNNLDNAITQAKNALATAKVTADQQITAAEAQVDNSYRAMMVAKAQLDKIISPSRSEDISLAEAQVRQAEAEIKSADYQITNSILAAPIDGVITKANYKIGENITPTIPVFVMLNEDSLYIEVDISESDINKVKLNNKAEITIDSFGDSVKFLGSVYFIEPAETKIQEVIYYKVKANLLPDSLGNLTNYKDKLKPGMTANLIITTIEKENVLLAPQRSIVEKNDQKFIKKFVNNNTEESPVETGYKGDNGLIEIISGSKVGEVVVISVKTK